MAPTRGRNEVRIVDSADLLVINAPAGFDPAAIDLSGATLITPEIERPAGRRPAGSASDVQWGVCFKAGAKITTYFQDATTNRFWSSSTGTFSATWPNPTWVYGNLSGVPGCSGTWSVTPPPASAHVSGHVYQYYACATDNGCTNCAVRGFTF